MKQLFLVLIFLQCLSTGAQHLEPILLDNPSFEGVPAQSVPPPSWMNCISDLNQSPPDTQPGFWAVSKAAQNGKSYLSMVVRETEKVEMVGQKLKRSLENTLCYKFSIYLSKSEIYKGTLEPSGEYKGDNTTPAKLRIWGGDNLGSKVELLAESDMITNSRWLQYNFEFNPKKNHTYFMLEAYYKTPFAFAYNGHILVDNASEITPFKCAKQLDTLVPTKILKDLDKGILKEGQVIKIDKLYFKADSATFNVESYPVLNEIYNFLNTNKEIVIEIGGHTNNTPPEAYCDKLSLARAKSVTQYLVDQGISSNRILYRGYGKRNPIVPNTTPEGRKKNQRVEIKIISIKK